MVKGKIIIYPDCIKAKIRRGLFRWKFLRHEKPNDFHIVFVSVTRAKENLIDSGIKPYEIKIVNKDG